MRGVGGGFELSATWTSPRRRPMTSSVSVVRACERQVSHTSSPILTEVSDISAAAADRLGFRCFAEGAVVGCVRLGAGAGLSWLVDLCGCASSQLEFFRGNRWTNFIG